MHEAPIYDRLVAELGDVPTEVRREAERTLRDLDQVIRPPGAFTPGGFPHPANSSPQPR